MPLVRGVGANSVVDDGLMIDRMDKMDEVEVDKMVVLCNII